MASQVIVEKPQMILDRTQRTARTASFSTDLEPAPHMARVFFSGFRFSYYYFTGATPSAQEGKLIPG